MESVSDYRWCYGRLFGRSKAYPLNSAIKRAILRNATRDYASHGIYVLPLRTRPSVGLLKGLLLRWHADARIKILHEQQRRRFLLITSLRKSAGISKLIEKLLLFLARIYLYYIHDEKTACAKHLGTYFRVDPPRVGCHFDLT